MFSEPYKKYFRSENWFYVIRLLTTLCPVLVIQLGEINYRFGDLQLVSKEFFLPLIYRVRKAALC